MLQLGIVILVVVLLDLLPVRDTTLIFESMTERSVRDSPSTEELSPCHSDADILDDTESLVGDHQRIVNGVTEDVLRSKPLKLPTRMDLDVEALGDTCLPWMDDYNSWMTGYNRKQLATSLFDISTIVDHTIPRAVCGRKRKRYYIELFFQMRFYSAKKKRTNPSSPDALLTAWNAFVANYNEDPTAWKNRFNTERDRVNKRTAPGMKMVVHQLSIKENIPCAVRKDQDCPMCYYDSPKLPENARTKTHPRYQLSRTLRLKISELDQRCGQEKQERHVKEDDEVDTYTEKMEALRLEQLLASSRVEQLQLKQSNQEILQELKSLRQMHHSLADQFYDLLNDLDDFRRKGTSRDCKRRREDKSL